MRWREIATFIICVGLAAPLVAAMGIFPGSEGISGSTIMTTFGVSAVVAILMGGGVSILGFSFKVPAVLSTFGTIYAAVTGFLTGLIAQLVRPWEVGVTISFGVLLPLLAVVGYFAALEIAGGAHGVME